MKVLVLWVALNSAIDRPAIARLLNLALGEARSASSASSALPVTLLGTLVDRRDACSAALVVDAARGRTVYLGDRVSGATVVRIERDRVVLERDGALYELRTHPLPLPPASTASSSSVHVSYADVRRSLPELATQVRVIPVANGFKLLAIAPDSLFAKVGLHNGDVVHIGLDALQQLKPGANVSVEIEREGRTFSLSGWID